MITNLESLCHFLSSLTQALGRAHGHRFAQFCCQDFVGILDSSSHRPHFSVANNTTVDHDNLRNKIWLGISLVEIWMHRFGNLTSWLYHWPWMQMGDTCVACKLKSWTAWHPQGLCLCNESSPCSVDFHFYGREESCTRTPPPIRNWSYLFIYLDLDLSPHQEKKKKQNFTL